MKTCLTFFEGYVKKIDLEITIDEYFEYKLTILKANQEYIPDKLFEDYIIYHNPYPFKSKIQNSVFHKYNGHVFVTHNSRELNEDDLLLFKEYTEEVLKKCKRTYIETKSQTKNVKQIYYKKPGALKIN